MENQIGFIPQHAPALPVVVPPSTRPNTTEVVVTSVRDRWTSYPSNGLTPEKLARILKEADQGQLQRQAELFEEMEEKDTHLSSQLQTRKTAVLGLDWEVMPASDSPDDKRVADFVRNALERIEGLEDNFLDLLDAIGKGISSCEIMWEIADGYAYIKGMKHIHQKRFYFDDKDELRVIPDQYPGVLIPDNKFVIHRYKARSGHPARAGVLRVCAWMYLFKNYSVKDWVAFAEIFGMPIRVGKYDPNASTDDKEALALAVTMLGLDASGIISKNTEIEFVEAAAASGNIHQFLAEFCNAEMSKAILGQTLTSDAGKNGSRALGTVHGDVRQDILESDAKSLAETLRKHVIKPLVRFNFGNVKLPWIKFHYEQPDDLKQEADVLKVIVSEIGLPVSEEYVYEKFGIPQPKPGEKLLVPPRQNQGLALPSLMANRWIPHSQDRTPDHPQHAVDGFSDKLLELGVHSLTTITKPIMELIANGNSLEEIRDQLLVLYKDIDTTELESLIGRSLFAADLYGRWTVKTNA